MLRHPLTLLALAVLATFGFPGRVLAGAHFVAELNGGQEVPPLGVAGTGTGSFELSDTYDALSFDITVTGLTGPVTAAHFHNQAAGLNGGVVRNISADFVGNTARGVWRSTDAQPLTRALVAQLLAGRIYVNVHTAANSSGEIRGQLVLRSGIQFAADLDGAQEVPPVATAGKGTAAMVLTSAGLRYDLTAHGLTGTLTNAHFHQGAAGVNGSVLHGFIGSFSGTSASGTWAITPAHIESLLVGHVYLNLHTTAAGNGEIRGQVEARTATGIGAVLDGAQEVPPVAGSGKGAFSGTLVPVAGGHKLVYGLTVTGLTGTITNAHFHVGAAGSNGGVVKTILAAFSGNTASGEWTPADTEPLTPDRVADLLAGRIYVNIHTTAAGSGEIRGQLRLLNGPSWTARLSGAQESPPAGTSAGGTGAFTLAETGLRYSVTYDGLSGAFTDAHLHEAPLGATGPVVRSLGAEFSGGSAVGTWAPADGEPFGTANILELLAGNTYVNVHSSSFGNGEIRGQLGEYAVASTPADPVAPRRRMLTVPGPNPFRAVTQIRYELPAPTRVRLRLLDVQGREVAILVDAVQEGNQTIRLDAGALSPGVYFIHLATPGAHETQKLVRIQ